MSDKRGPVLADTSSVTPISFLSEDVAAQQIRLGIGIRIPGGRFPVLGQVIVSDIRSPAQGLQCDLVRASS